jgi:hypothetical protein
MTKFIYTLSNEQKTKNNTEYEALEINLKYTLGGYNYFSGNYSPRGYKLSISPCTISEGNFGRTCTYTLLGGRWESGLQFPLEQVSRKSKKAHDKWNQILTTEIMLEIGELYAENKIKEISVLIEFTLLPKLIELK